VFSSVVDASSKPFVAVIGLGYVGLPLCLAFANAGRKALGVDLDEAKVKALCSGRSYIKHIESSAIKDAVEAGRLSATTDFFQLSQAGSILICVPTPLTPNRVPDLSFVESTAASIAPHLRMGQLVVLESTTYPGTTEEVVRPILERGSGLVAGRDFHLAFSPEREDPGNPTSLKDIPKVVGGLNEASSKAACDLYGTIVKQVVPVGSCGAAEATKLLENIFRSVNIALVNELKVIYAAMGIDIWEVIRAASTKPFGFMPFFPGPGLGGHCIPIDPFYLTWKAMEYGYRTRLIELAGEINTAMPEYVVGRVVDALNDSGKSAKGARVLLLGLTIVSRRLMKSCNYWRSGRHSLTTTIRMFPRSSQDAATTRWLVASRSPSHAIMTCLCCARTIASTAMWIFPRWVCRLSIAETQCGVGRPATIRREARGVRGCFGESMDDTLLGTARRGVLEW
jgi:UDP-N-acetyl-D-glucosamine dehydrogenase